MTLIDRLREKIAEDLNRMRGGDLTDMGIYRHILPCNPKPYPISGFQHFFGAAFIAARLAEFSGMSEEDQVVAFLAGLLHDYEKIGLSLQEISANLEEVLGPLYDILDEHAPGRLLKAVEIASKLESGGLLRNLQVIAEFVRLGDYLTGGEESWNIAYVMSTVAETLDSLGVKYYLVPVVIGRQRPIVAMVAERLNETLANAGFTPLVSTPTGSLYLSKSPVTDTDIKKFYDELTSYISDETKKALSPAVTGKPRPARLRSIYNLVHARERRPNIGGIISSLPNLRQLSVSDIEETFRTYATPEDRIILIIWSVLVYAKTLGSVKGENLREALKELELDFVSGNDVQEVAINLYDSLSRRDLEYLSSLAEMIKSKLVEKMLSAEIDVSDVRKTIEKTVGIGQFIAMSKATKEPVEGAVCAICRERVSKTRALRVYLDRLKRILNVNVSELFHPDAQGRPEDYRALEGLSNRVHICPVCEYESIVFPTTTSFFDGMWASVLAYYPAVSIDLLRVIKEVAKHYVVVGVKRPKEEREALVIPDYVSSKVIVKTSDERGRLTKQDLLQALDLWYFVGGNLILTTNALSAPPPWSGLPLDMETSDIVMKESVAKFMEELRLARKKSEWSRTRMLRLILYMQLRTYVENLEQAEIELGRSRFLKSGLVVSNAPSLDVYSLALRKLI